MDNTLCAERQLNPSLPFRNFDMHKVLGAFGVNAGMFASVPHWVSEADVFLKTVLTLAQIGVAIATIVYIAVKTRNAKKDSSKSTPDE